MCFFINFLDFFLLFGLFPRFPAFLLLPKFLYSPLSSKYSLDFYPALGEQGHPCQHLNIPFFECFDFFDDKFRYNMYTQTGIFKVCRQENPRCVGACACVADFLGLEKFESVMIFTPGYKIFFRKPDLPPKKDWPVKKLPGLMDTPVPIPRMATPPAPQGKALSWILK